MPAGFFVDGKLTYRPLVSVLTEFAGRAGLSPASKTLAVVGEFAFLKPNTPYVFTSESAFISAVAPTSSLMRDLAKMIFSPSSTAPFSGSPAAVILINAKPSTRAATALLDGDDANAVTLSANIWGQQGNSTVVRIAPTGDLFTVTVSNRGASESFTVDNGEGALVVAYKHPGVPAGATGDASTAAYGLDNTNGGSIFTALAMSKAKDESDITFLFSRNIRNGTKVDSPEITKTVTFTFAAAPSGFDAADITTTNGTLSEFVTTEDPKVFRAKLVHLSSLTPTFTYGPGFAPTVSYSGSSETTPGRSWIPDAPLRGKFLINKPDNAENGTDGTTLASTLAADNDLVVRFYGTDVNGASLSHAVTIPRTNVIASGDWESPETPEFLSVERVSIYTTNNGAWVGSVNIAGTAAVFGPSSGHESVAEVIDGLNQVKGFVASTESFRANSIPAAKLDPIGDVLVGAPTGGDPTDNNPPMPATASALKFLLLEGFATYSSMIEAAEVSNTGKPIIANTTTGTVVVCSNGSESAAVLTSWETAFSSLSTSPVTVLYPYSQDNDVHKAAFAHTKFMWGKGQREMQVVISPANELPLNTLLGLRRAYADFRVTVLPQSSRITRWNGQLSEYDTKYTGLIFAAMQCANADIGFPLGGSRPNIAAFKGHSSIEGPDAADLLISNGFTPLEDRGDGIRFVRWVTAYGEDNDPCRTEGSAVESVALSNIGVRRAVRPFLNIKAASGVAGAIRSAIAQELTFQKSAGYIRNWYSDTLKVTETQSSYLVRYQMSPVLPVNNIAVTAVVIAFPLA